MARLVKEITVKTNNQVGALAKVLAPIQNVDVNIEAICAWGEKDEGFIYVIADDHAKGLEALKGAGLSVEEKEVVLVELDNKSGTLAEASKALANAGVHIIYCYGSADASKVLLVFATRDNSKALEVLG